MSKNIKEIGKELLGKSLNSFHRKTGLTQLEKNNEMQDGILDGILSQVDDAYIEKTEQSNVIHLDGSGDGIVVLDSIEGNTMVNLHPTDLKIGSGDGQDSSTTWHVGVSMDKTRIKPNTYYTVFVLNSSGKVNRCYFNLCRDTVLGLNENNSSLFYTDNYERNIAYIHFYSTEPVPKSEVINTKIVVLEGDYTNCSINFIDGLQSSFEEKVNDEGKYEIEILSKNKSLIDWNIENLENHRDDSFNFSIEDNSIKVKSNYQKAYGFKKGFYVQEGEIYTISVEGKKTDGEYSAMYLGDETLDYFKKDTFILVPANTSGNILDGSNYGTKVVTMVARKSGFVNRWIIHSGGQGNYYWIRNMFLEKGETVSCIPQKQNKIKLLINEPLRAVDDIKDGLCVKDSKLVVERNLKEIVINNTSNIIVDGSYLVVSVSGYNIKSSLGLSDKFAIISLSDLGKVKGLYIQKRSDKHFYVWFSNNENTTVQDLKTWLQNNPTKLVFQTIEPYYEEVLNEYGEPIVLEGYEDGTIYIDSTIIPTTTVRYTPKMESFKTLKEVNKNNNMITLDINENIIPYMMDVDYMIMEKELCLLNTKNIRKMEELDMTSMQKRTQDMLERLIKGKTLTEQECKTRVTTYLNAGKITDEQAEELMLVISEVYA